MRFCFLTTFYPPFHFGGEAAYLYALSNELARRGHEVTVVHCVDSYRALTSAGPRGEFPHHPNVTVVALESRLGRLSPVVTYLTGKPGLKKRPLESLFAANSFDVTHFHLATLIGGPGVLRYGDGVKLYTTHDHWLVCPMYDLWQDNREVCVTPHCARCTMSFRRPPQLWRHTGLLGRELSNVDLFLSPSASTIEQHRRRGFDYPMRRLPNFLPVAEVVPARSAAVPRRPYFLFVGRLVKLKGVQTLIETFRRYDGADLLIAGDGVYEQELRTQAAGLDHVQFLGRVGREELGELYANAIALLVPSLAYETFGVVALEAFAQATPVIAREHGAVPELVHESGGGFTYRTEGDLLEAMEALRQDPARRRELGERGYRGYVERWSEEPHVRAYFAAIDEARELRAGRPVATAVAA
jgi:glycosyltransferase involved in cell wall biosynthesis